MRKYYRMMWRSVWILGICILVTVSFSPAQDDPAPEKTEDIEHKSIHIPLEQGKFLTLQALLKSLLKEFSLEAPPDIGTTDRKIDLSGIKGFVAVRTISLTLGSKLDAEIDRGILILTYRREDMLEIKDTVRRSLVKILLRLFQAADNPLDIRDQKYGINKANTHEKAKLPVLLVHGIDSGPACFKDIIREFGSKWNIYVFKYPNDQAIRTSAEFMSEELGRSPYPPLCVLTHSMGALVVREYVSDPELYNTEVKKILMAVPPNHGSRIAGLRHVLEYAEAFRIVTAEDGKWKDVLIKVTSDGLGRAGDDLKPGSLFLDRLSRKKLPEGISCAVIAGEQGLMSEQQHNELVQWLNNKKKSITNMPLQMAFSKVVNDIEKTKEVIHGKGDIAVTVESAKLEGAVFFKIFRRNHLTILRGENSSPVFRVIDEFFSPEAQDKKEQ